LQLHTELPLPLRQGEYEVITLSTHWILVNKCNWKLVMIQSYFNIKRTTHIDIWYLVSTVLLPFPRNTFKEQGTWNTNEVLTNRLFTQQVTNKMMGNTIELQDVPTCIFLRHWWSWLSRHCCWFCRMMRWCWSLLDWWFRPICWT